MVNLIMKKIRNFFVIMFFITLVTYGVGWWYDALIGFEILVGFNIVSSLAGFFFYKDNSHPYPLFKSSLNK